MELDTVYKDLDKIIDKLVTDLTTVLRQRIINELALNSSVTTKELFGDCNQKPVLTQCYNVFNSSYRDQIKLMVERNLLKERFLCDISFDLNKKEQVVKILYKTRIIPKTNILEILWKYFAMIVVTTLFVSIYKRFKSSNEDEL